MERPHCTKTNLTHCPHCGEVAMNFPHTHEKSERQSSCRLPLHLTTPFNDKEKWQFLCLPPLHKKTALSSLLKIYIYICRNSVIVLTH